MKLIAFILAFYIVALTAIPCDDLACIDVHECVTISSEVDHNHSDSCSPFCICQCCQVHFNLTTFVEYTFQQDAPENYSSYLITEFPPAPSEFLIPPEDSSLIS